MLLQSGNCIFRNHSDIIVNELLDGVGSLATRFIKNSNVYGQTNYVGHDLIPDIEYAPIDMPRHLSRQDHTGIFTFGSQKYTTMA